MLLLIHRGGSPLIIDQPEDDLDNRFVCDDIVRRLRETKENAKSSSQATTHQVRRQDAVPGAMPRSLLG